MIDKNKIIEVLKKYPNGLKAREIAKRISGADKKSVNQILYANQDCFSAKDFIWTLSVDKNERELSATEKPEISDTSKKVRIEDFQNFINKLYHKKIYISDIALLTVAGIPKNKYDEIKKNWKLLKRNKFIPQLEKNSKSDYIESIIQILLNEDLDIDIITNRSLKIYEVQTSITFYFDIWCLLISLPIKEFNNYILYAKKIHNQINLNIFDCYNWYDLVKSLSVEKTFPVFVVRYNIVKSLEPHILAIYEYENWEKLISMDKKDFNMIISRLKCICETEPSSYMSIIDMLSFDKILEICLLPQSQFEDVLTKINKMAVLLNQKAITLDWLINYLSKKSTSKNTDSLLSNFLLENFEIIDSLCQKYEEQIQAEKYLIQAESCLVIEQQYKAEKSYREKAKIDAVKRGSCVSIEMGKVCIGNCATCNREECIENKK